MVKLEREEENVVEAKDLKDGQIAVTRRRASIVLTAMLGMHCKLHIEKNVYEGKLEQSADARFLVVEEDTRTESLQSIHFWPEQVSAVDFNIEYTACRIAIATKDSPHMTLSSRTFEDVSLEDDEL